MSNIIKLNETAPNNEWIVMSNQGTDCFLDLLIIAADGLEKTEHQKELISFLKDQKEINEISPGSAGFDLDEMPWQAVTLKNDAEFLLRAAAAAQSESTFKQLPYEVNADIMCPWLKQFAVLVKHLKGGTFIKEDFEIPFSETILSIHGQNDRAAVKMLIPKEYDSLMYDVAERFRAGSFALFEWELETLKEFVNNFYSAVESNGCVTLEDFTVFMDFLCIVKDADNEDVQNLIARAFMKSAEIRNRLSEKKDQQPITEGL